MSTRLIDVSKLQEAAVIWDKTLRSLPYLSIEEIGKKLKFNVMELQGKHSLIHERRRAGGTQSYKPGKTMSYFEKLLKYEPSAIEPKDVVFVTRENSKKYDDNELLIVGGVPVDNKGKKHPLETRVVFNLVRSHGEDVCIGLFAAERDENASSPLTAFDGIFTKIDMLVAAGDITATRGNLSTTGEIKFDSASPSTEAYDKLVEFIGTASNFLKSNKNGLPQLLAAENALMNARSALRFKLKALEYPTMARMLEHLREDAICPDLIIDTDSALGTGSRLTLQKVGNMDLAFNTKSAGKFVQIRDIYEDPNDWQFWLQAGYDTRIRDWHEKVFRTNEQSNTALDLSGDYV